MTTNAGEAAEQVIRKVIPESRPDSAKRSLPKVSKLLDDIKTPLISVANSLSMAAQPRVALVRSTPTAPQIVANYTRGLVLFGRSPAFPARFMWRSFPFRSVITQETAKIPRDVRRTQRRSDLKVKFDEDFESIIHSCQAGRDNWVWLTSPLIDVYREVQRLGFVATVGVYRDDELVAGLWGISVGRAFGIMSAFHRENGAGSLAIGALVEVVISDKRWSIIDSGVIDSHYIRFGAFEVPVDRFCELVWQSVRLFGSANPRLRWSEQC